MNNVVLFIAVHPDDETLGCSGTILKHRELGDEIYWLILTSPTLCHPYGFSEDIVEQRRNLIDEISIKYGFCDVIQMGLPPQLLQDINFREIVSKIDEVLNFIKPNIVYMNFFNDVHSDHRIAFNACYSCTKNFRKPFIRKVYLYEVLSETEFAPSINAYTFVPNVFVDITDYLKQKIEIMSLYETELMKEPFPRSIGTIEALARYRGSRIGVMYAEAFMLVFEKQ